MRCIQSLRVVLCWLSLLALPAGCLNADSLQYQVTSGAVSGPPYPTGAITMNVTSQSGVPIGIMSLEIESVAPSIALLLTPGAAVGGIQPTPFIEVAGVDPTPFAGVVIVNPCFDIDPFGGSSPLLGTPGVVPVPEDGKSFDVFFDMSFELVSAVGATAHQGPLFSMTASGDFTAVPEPLTLLPIGFAVMGILAYVRRRNYPAR